MLYYNMLRGAALVAGPRLAGVVKLSTLASVNHVYAKFASYFF